MFVIKIEYRATYAQHYGFDKVIIRCSLPSEAVYGPFETADDAARWLKERGWLHESQVDRKGSQVLHTEVPIELGRPRWCSSYAFENPKAANSKTLHRDRATVLEILAADEVPSSEEDAEYAWDKSQYSHARISAKFAPRGS